MQPPIPPVEPIEKSNSMGITSIVLSALGLMGWVLMLILMLSMPYTALTGDGQHDLFISIGNLWTFIVRALIGIVGICVNGTLSSIGLLLSFLGMTSGPRHSTYIGMGLATVGLLMGIAIVVWRMVALGFH